jgi:hypothetical protein
MAMNHANSQYHTSDHVNIARNVRQARTGVVANPQVQSVRQFLDTPLHTFTTPEAFNPSHLLPPQDLTGAPEPMTKTARTAIWSRFAANVSEWYKGYHPREASITPTIPGSTPFPGPGYTIGLGGR